MDMVVGANVLSAWAWGMRWLPAPNPNLMSSVTDYGRLQGRVKVPPANCVCLGQAQLDSLPRLVDEESDLGDQVLCVRLKPD